MKVIRKAKYKIKNNDFQVGDKINIYLEDLDKDCDFTLTAQEISKDGAWFLFDDPVCERQRKGLEEWLNNDFLEMFSKEWRNRIKAVTIPSWEQIFGNGEWTSKDEAEWYKEHIVPTNDKLFFHMLLRKNRLRFDENERLCWWWLRNAYKNSEEDTASPAYFAAVDRFGSMHYRVASDSLYVVPILLITNPIFWSFHRQKH